MNILLRIVIMMAYAHPSMAAEKIEKQKMPSLPSFDIIDSVDQGKKLEDNIIEKMNKIFHFSLSNPSFDSDIEENKTKKENNTNNMMKNPQEEESLRRAQGMRR
jgi:hypothetical protein